MTEGCSLHTFLKKPIFPNNNFSLGQGRREGRINKLEEKMKLAIRKQKG